MRVGLPTPLDFLADPVAQSTFDGDLDILTTEEGAGNFTAGKGVLWLENRLLPPAATLVKNTLPAY